jgi:hypothetical protein
MKSPFPGMDPFLEQHWRDVHHSLCTYARDALQPQLRPALLARIEERLVVEAPEYSQGRSIYPDTKIVERAGHEQEPVSSGGGTATLVETETITEPLILRIDEQPTEGFIEIVDPSTGGKLVTVIEFLSPSNKSPGPGQEQYRKKQRELREAGVNLVEVNLLRGGEWVMQAPLSRIAKKDRTPYCVVACRTSKLQYEYYRIPLASRLPVIKIPLRPDDADAKLNLQTLIDQTYLNGAYDGIDYRQPLDPPLQGDAATWVESTLRTAGKLK